ncbi:MAG: glycosyltransferase family 2 protein [Deltaproteobacteria bacterium]|nr:glycosyltransferase family 2 protein [Deltaproteobacteria bacterium]
MRAKRLEISVIIVNWNTCDLLRQCLRSVYQTLREIPFEVIVVDNASADGSAAMVAAEFPQVRAIVNAENRGFAAANNQALRVMAGRYALLLNSDAVLLENAAATLYRFLETCPDAAMAFGQLLNADGSLQNSIAAFPTLWTLLANTALLEYLFPRRYPSKRYPHPAPIEIESGIGACLLVRKAAVDAVGMLDERYVFFFEETDWAFQMRRAGWKICHVPAARIIHHQGRSIGRNVRSRIAFYRSRYQFFRKWRSDAYYVAVRIVVFMRLAADWLLTSAGVLMTLGLKRALRDKWMVYGQLLLWHLRCCP